MKKRKQVLMAKVVLMLVCALMLNLGLMKTAHADVAPGDIIDKTNWQKAQGLVSDAMLDFLKKGYIIIKVGKLNFNPADIMQKYYKESMTKNIGRYDVTPNGEIVDKKTGEKDPMDIVGFPFPQIDPKDPMAPYKLIYNHKISMGQRGNIDAIVEMRMIGTKLEKTLSIREVGMWFLGEPALISEQSKVKSFGTGKLSGLMIVKVTEPYELNGLTTASHGYWDNSKDKVYAYVPATRRVRTTSSSTRADVLFGTEVALDDMTGGFDGKARDFNCKLVRSQDALVSYIGPDVIPAVKRPDGSYDLKRPYKTTTYGYQTPGWQGKAWAPTNTIYVKQKAYVIECMAKDSAYSYGKFEVWLDATGTAFRKTVWDRGNKRWKVLESTLGAYMSSDGLCGRIDADFGDWVYDEQRDHATVHSDFLNKDKKFWAKLTPDTYTVGGITKFAK